MKLEMVNYIVLIMSLLLKFADTIHSHNKTTVADRIFNLFNKLFWCRANKIHINDS